MKIIKPKYGIGEVVIIKCPDDNCRRTHVGTVIAIGGANYILNLGKRINLGTSKKFTDKGEFLRELRVGDTVHYVIRYKNHVLKTIEENDIIKVDTVATMKAIKND